MAKLIDADLLLQWVEKLEAYNMGRASCFKRPKGVTPEGLRHMVDTMPKVDAVEVVRCKDCKSWVRYEIPVNCKSGRCRKHPCTMNDDDFCSYGKRRTDETKAD